MSKINKRMKKIQGREAKLKKQREKLRKECGSVMSVDDYHSAKESHRLPGYVGNTVKRRDESLDDAFVSSMGLVAYPCYVGNKVKPREF